VKVQKLEQASGFVVYDLDGAETAVGVTRCAPKILQDGAKLLARSMTYLFASFELQMSGASAAVNAPADDREAALAAYVAEVAPDVEAKRFLTEPAKGVGPRDLAKLRELDSRSDLYWAVRHELRALGAAAVADAAVGGLDGKTVAIEGFDIAGPALAADVVERGGRIVAVGTGDGIAVNTSGLDSNALADAWVEHSVGLVAHLGDAQAAEDIFTSGADVLFTGSKAGVIDHDVAAGLGATAVVPIGPVPVTAKALAVLRRAGSTVIPDFISLAGPLFAMWPAPDVTVYDIRSQAIPALAESITDLLTHDDGPFLAGCYRAEAFLGTWQDDLPFGRPLA
jgi:glutamate dehydrogenase/leucine dehydrogenase